MSFSPKSATSIVPCFMRGDRQMRLLQKPECPFLVFAKFSVFHGGGLSGVMRGPLSVSYAASPDIILRSCSCVASCCANLADDPPSAHHEDPRRQVEQFREFGRDQDDPHARWARSSISPCSALFAPMSTPRVGSSRISTRASPAEPSCEHDLLLIPAAQMLDRCLDIRVP